MRLLVCEVVWVDFGVLEGQAEGESHRGLLDVTMYLCYMNF